MCEEKSVCEKCIEERREYQSEWRAKNKDKVREYNRRYWEKKATGEIVAAITQEVGSGD